MQIRHVTMKMPYKHHHERIWRLLSSFKRLKQLEVWLHKTTMADSSEWDNCINGAKDCKRLMTFVLRREEDERDAPREEVLEKDRQTEGKINAMLREREDDRAGSRSRSRPSSKDGEGEDDSFSG